MADIITNGTTETRWDELPSNVIVKVIVGCLLEIGDLDADNEHVANAYRLYRNDDSLYTTERHMVEFNFGGATYIVMDEDNYEEYYEQQLEYYLDDLEYDLRRQLEDTCVSTDYVKFDREAFARDIDFGCERGGIIGTYDGYIHEASWGEWWPREDGKRLYNRDYLYFWRID